MPRLFALNMALRSKK